MSERSRDIKRIGGSIEKNTLRSKSRKESTVTGTKTLNKAEHLKSQIEISAEQ